jgi:isocitrate dehydrogenase
MPANDFFANEQSLTLPEATTARIEHIAADGSQTILREGLELQAGEILDATFMSARHYVLSLPRKSNPRKRMGSSFRCT